MHVLQKSKFICPIYGLVAAWIVSAILTIIMALFFYKFNMTKDKAQIAVLFVYVIANFIGGFVCGKMAKTKKFLKGLMSGILFFAVLLAASLIANKGGISEISNILLTAVLCCGSAMFGGMIS